MVLCRGGRNSRESGEGSWGRMDCRKSGVSLFLGGPELAGLCVYFQDLNCSTSTTLHLVVFWVSSSNQVRTLVVIWEQKCSWYSGRAKLSGCR